MDLLILFTNPIIHNDVRLLETVADSKRRSSLVSRLIDSYRTSQQLADRYFLPPSADHRKDPWRLSTPRKARQRQRLRDVDLVISTIADSGVQCAPLTRALELPTEAEMSPRDKYTTFDKKGRDFRKSVHKVSERGRSMGEMSTAMKY